MKTYLQPKWFLLLQKHAPYVVRVFFGISLHCQAVWHSPPMCMKCPHLPGQKSLELFSRKGQFWKGVVVQDVLFPPISTPALCTLGVFTKGKGVQGRNLQRPMWNALRKGSSLESIFRNFRGSGQERWETFAMLSESMLGQKGPGDACNRLGAFPKATDLRYPGMLQCDLGLHGTSQAVLRS